MKIDVENFELQDYLGHAFPCACGKLHTTHLQHVHVAEDAKKDIRNYLKEQGFTAIYMIEDENTHKVYGKELEAYLTNEGIEIDHVILEADVVPNETALFHMLVNMKRRYDYILGVGSGTLNDLCKFISNKISLNYGIVATAPSMDGFASDGAALIIDDLKTTYNCQAPTAIFADLDVIANAPLPMIKAGLGDILGKYNCLVDWKISHIITDEYYCKTIADMVYKSVQEVIDHIDGVLTRDKAAVKKITEALIVTGVAMSFVGNSRPASGSEHHISHYWEMKFLFAHHAPVFHGTKVGVATPGVIAMWKKLAERTIDFDTCRKQVAAFDYAQWETLVKDRFEGAASGVIALEKKEGKNNIEKALQHIDVIEEKWIEIKNIIEQDLPQPEKITDILKSVNAAYRPQQIDIHEDMIKDGVILAKEVRVRYGLLQLLWDLGLLEEFSEIFESYYRE